MRRYRLLILTLILGGIAAVLFLISQTLLHFEQSSREYLVEINRLTNALSLGDDSASALLPQMKRVKTMTGCPLRLMRRKHQHSSPVRAWLRTTRSCPFTAAALYLAMPGSPTHRNRTPFTSL